MIVEFLGWEFAHALALMFGLETIGIGKTELTDKEREEIVAVVRLLRVGCERLKLDVSAELARTTERMFEGGHRDPEVAVARIRAIETSVRVELLKHRFASVAPDKVEHFGQEMLFGQAVYDRFESARDDIRDAGDAYAVGLNTAAVFHLMRVAERGLRALATSSRVKIRKTPLEWAEWQTLITAIRKKKYEPLSQKHRGPKKDADLEFYSGALGEFEAFKDAYRNHVMHTRKAYDEHKAASVLLHVREFMQRLAPRVG